MRPFGLAPQAALGLQLLAALAGLGLRCLYPGQILIAFLWVFLGFALVHLLAGWAHSRQADFRTPAGQAVYAGLNLAYLLFFAFQSDLIEGAELWGPQVYLNLPPAHPLVAHSADLLLTSLGILTVGYTYVLTQSVMGRARRQREVRGSRQGR